jgi:KDEL-tailed cysteine endopeptidase
MKQAILLALVLLATGAAADQHLRAQHDQELLGAKANPRQGFWHWLHKHEKQYKHDVREFEKRFRIWVDNLDFITQYNAKAKSHWLGLNALADLSHDEFKQKYALGYNKYLRNDLQSRPQSFMYGDLDEANLPLAVDWRETKAVSEVKNQLQCGSCWAFSTTGAVEGINAIVTNDLVSLSEQELVDCDTTKDKGCSGGLMDFAFDFIHRNKGIHTEEDYPYTGVDGVCEDDSRADKRVVTIDGYEDVPPYDEVALKKAASRQPVSVAIEADQRAFQLYQGGVFDDENCGEQLDHGVLLVGYGVESRPSEDGDDDDSDDNDPQKSHNHHNYWIVKNSWGAGWGDQGYIKIRMGRGKAGLCGIAMQPSYPVKKGPNPPAPAPGPPGPKPPTPGPSPEPVDCDQTHQCPPSTTCCCLMDLAGFCFSWGCCPMQKAVCCDDKEHCCPHDLPVCDTAAGRCLPQKGAGFAASVPWSSKTPATKKDGSWWSRRQQNDRQVIKPFAS